MKVETDMPPAPRKKYTRRNLVAKPEEAIGKEFVECCLCGRKVQNLTTRHLLSHGISMDEYKKLCGYALDQKLICGNLMEKLQKNVLRAYNSRKKKPIGRAFEISRISVALNEFHLGHFFCQEMTPHASFQ